MKLRFLLVLASTAVCMVGNPPPMAPDVIVENYCAASRSQAQIMQGATMDMEIEATLPTLKKQGKLHALRKISQIGRITYEALKFEGDGTVKNQVIARYLSAEAEAQKDESASAAIAVTPANYKFKYKGRVVLEGREVHIFQVSPRKKRQGMFQGEVWIDAATYLRVQESGRLVKNPSIFLKRVDFVRRYEIRDGLSVPRQVQSVVNTRLVGKAELTIDYSNISIDPAKRGAMGGSDGQ